MTREDFSRRVEKLIPLLYRVCVTQLSSATDREDAVQSALERAWLKCDTLKEDRYFETWMVRILINECHNIHRLRARECGGEIPEVPVEDECSDLRDALRALDPKWRIPILLHYIQGYRVREIARMLGTPVSTVQTRMMRGRRKLKAMLTEEVFGNDHSR